MLRKPLLTVLLFVLAVFVYSLFQSGGDFTEPEPVQDGTTELLLPELDEAGYNWIGSRIFENEARGQVEYLTYWGDGEDFPSLGIGHFIWFPTGVDAPFDEQFPDMVDFVLQQNPEGVDLPFWMQELDPFDSPWTSKVQFDEAWASPEMTSLRSWLQTTQKHQAGFIVSAFEERWRNLELPEQQKSEFNTILQQLVATPEGLFALIDYYNFKGLGNNPRETYDGQGWGLLQVLQLMTEQGVDEQGCNDLLLSFRDAAADRLRLRVELSPPDRRESRWLAGWSKRLDDYLVSETRVGDADDCGFRVTPYLQNPANDAITVSWLSKNSRAGNLRIWKQGGNSGDRGILFKSRPVKAEALEYHAAENCYQDSCASSLPYLHQLRVNDLEPDSSYRYEVKQGRSLADGSFSTPGELTTAYRFIVYADSETEPESTGKHAWWQGDSRSTQRRKYPVDQSTGYAQNLSVIQARQPGIIAIAGDLVQSGGEQRDWDEFWLHNARLAATTVILPALGNHEYFAGPGELGKYATEDSERAVRKYQSYFDLPDNGSTNDNHSERYYAIRYGPVTLIVIDTTDGLPHMSDQDTNWRLRGEGDAGQAPDWHPGSEQFKWLEKELSKAQQPNRFTFVMFHGAPYSVGVHAKPPGEGNNEDILSALPIRALTPVFQRYGVDAVFNGHDEMYEHSIVPGLEMIQDGSTREHEIHFLDVGIGGDGLRGPLRTISNPFQVFLAHDDAPEVYGTNGVLQDGGKHYGHLEINLTKDAEGSWQARFDPVYVFPLMDVDGRVLEFERRVYDDSFSFAADHLE